MSGETEDQVSGWTVDTLHAHLLRMMNERDQRYNERDRRYEQRFQSQETARANLTRETHDRFASVNEFRAQLGDIVGTFMSRAETEQRIHQVNERIDGVDQKIDVSAHVRADAVSVINSRLDILTGKATGSSAVVGYIFGAAAAGASLAAIVAALID